MSADVFASALLKAFHKLTGLRVIAVQDEDHVVWWNKDPVGGDVFTCMVGDRKMTVDELAE